MDIYVAGWMAIDFPLFHLFHCAMFWHAVYAWLGGQIESTWYICTWITVLSFQIITYFVKVLQTSQQYKSHTTFCPPPCCVLDHQIRKSTKPVSFSLQTSYTLYPTENVAAVLLLLGTSSMELRLITGIYPALKWVLQPMLGSVLLILTHIRQFILPQVHLQERPQQQYQLYKLITKLLILQTINTFCRLLGTIIIKICVENKCSATDHLAWPTKLL